MTTSVLLTHTRTWLNANDLQALRDYALEAPSEWRHAFDELVEAYEELEESEELIERIDVLEDRGKAAAKTIREELDALQAGYNVQRFHITNKDVVDGLNAVLGRFTERMQKLALDLEGAPK